MSEGEKCFFCGSECEIFTAPLNHSVKDYRCRYCGPYLLDDFSVQRDSHLNDTEDKFRIACLLNERRLKGLGGIAFSDKTDKDNKVYTYPQVSVDDLLNEFPKNASEFLHRTLLNLSRLRDGPFDVIVLSTMKAGDRLQLFLHAQTTCDAFLRELEEQGFIRHNIARTTKETGAFFLTIKFWEIVGNLQREEIGNKRAFVAMWFDGSMNDCYKNGIEKAVREAGYDPVRIDLKDFNEKICDQIFPD
jgi:hypothetical protein